MTETQSLDVFGCPESEIDPKFAALAAFIESHRVWYEPPIYLLLPDGSLFLVCGESPQRKSSGRSQ